MLIVAVLKLAKQTYAFKIYSYCLMSHHYHIVIDIADSTSLSEIMKRINWQISWKMNRQEGKSGHLWESRFSDFIIENNSYLLDVIDCVHLNPAKANTTDKPEDYRWSSYRFYAFGQSAC